MIDLKKLQPDHPLRNRPLAEIEAQYRLINSERWNTVAPRWAIGNVTFNQLGPVWTENHEWRTEET